ncbi:hypothetical protein [Flavobacterium psychrotrophum]|uniref:hypothetical protein n=1 Tax=Flavobacterium psychrotrophum TaxID=2294119 RepID=UPI000E31E2A4|nr:hypothetical protein [Flavobacterium psychrotrophum]
MIKSEPKSILQFMATHYEVLKELFEVQKKNDFVSHQALQNCLQFHQKDILAQLTEYNILTALNNDYLFGEPYLALFEFIHQQFRPLLPEEIEQYGQAIKSLFWRIRDGMQQDKNMLLECIEALSSQIRKFTEAVVNNTKSLLLESRDLKANTKKIDYSEKIALARHLIENYISPLNKILDVNHTQSIYNELLTISQFCNTQRFRYPDEGIRRDFEKLYQLLGQAGRDLNTQSGVLTSELLPLIERIKTESQYLSGFHHYLTNGNCYRSITPPSLLTTPRENIYSKFIYENTKEYFGQFQNETQIIVIENPVATDDWFFEKSTYKANLNNALPVKDFFSWCEDAIRADTGGFTIDNFFIATSLLFEEEYEITPAGWDETIKIENETAVLILPKLKIKKRNDIPG